MCLAVRLVRPDVETVFLLPQVVRDIHVPQQWQLAARLFRARFNFAYLLGQHILMAHHHHRHSAPAIGFEPFAHLLRVIPGSVHHIFATDLALVGLDNPFITFAAHARRRREPQDLRAQRTRPLGQRLRQLRRIDIAVGRIVKRALKIMRL